MTMRGTIVPVPAHSLDELPIGSGAGKIMSAVAVQEEVDAIPGGLPETAIQMVATVGAPVLDVYPVSLQVTDLNGDAVERVQRFMVTMTSTFSGLVPDPTLSFRLEVVTGTEVNPMAGGDLANTLLVLDTLADGTASLTLTDPTGDTGELLLLIFTPMSAPGVFTPGFPSTAVAQMVV